MNNCYLKEPGLRTTPARIRTKLDDGASWPRIGGVMDDLEWRLRHASQTVSISDQMAAASIISAFRHLVKELSQKERNRVCVALQKDCC